MSLVRNNITKTLVLFTLLLNGSTILAQTLQTHENKPNEINSFIQLIYTRDTAAQNLHLQYIEENWKAEYSIMILELAYFKFDTNLGVRLMDILIEKTGEDLGYSINSWYRYLWSKEEKLLANYDYFKAELYKNIDPRFERYFLDRRKNSQIRFDEIRWGGVKQDGIPPLHDPKMISAGEANYLADDNIVFGIEINGDARAYPKRILAWHEMFTATVGGEHVTGVYCTLCGTVIIYKSTKDSVKYNLGTSGFLFRSNKLMYDKKTQSLWSTVWGEPVVGPLAGQGIRLDYLSVVTTTWGEWKKRHPETQVLDVNTGYKRDYDEGVAYHDYFSTDDIMFSVPRLEHEKIKNKQSVLALRLQDDMDEPPVAISTKFLKKNPVYQYTIGQKNLLVLTDKTGANRVYEVGERSFKKYNSAENYIMDDEGRKWKLYEAHLENDAGEKLKRFQAFNAFWFGWQAAYPNTVLVR